MNHKLPGVLMGDHLRHAGVALARRGRER